MHEQSKIYDYIKISSQQFKTNAYIASIEFNTKACTIHVIMITYNAYAYTYYDKYKQNYYVFLIYKQVQQTTTTHKCVIESCKIL